MGLDIKKQGGYSRDHLITGPRVPIPSAGRQFKDAIYEQLGRVGKALASPRRLELLDLLCQGARTVERLAEETGLSVANTSQHLQILRRARLIDVERQGQYAVYRMAGQEACE